MKSRWTPAREASVRWLHRNGVAAGYSTLLLEAARELKLPEGEGYVWVAAESATAKRAARSWWASMAWTAPHPRGQLLEARRRRARVARRLSLTHPDSGGGTVASRSCRERLNAVAAFNLASTRLHRRASVPASRSGWRRARPFSRRASPNRARPVQREGTCHAVRPQVAQRRRHDGPRPCRRPPVHRRRQLRRALPIRIETVLTAAGRHDVGAETVAGLARIQVKRSCARSAAPAPSSRRASPRAASPARRDGKPRRPAAGGAATPARWPRPCRRPRQPAARAGRSGD